MVKMKQQKNIRLIFSLEGMALPTKEKEEPSLAFGGQAVIEGVMIRSKKHMVVCVRQPNDEVLTNVKEIKSISERHKIARLPFLRGIVALCETLYIGVQGLYLSANASLEEEEEEKLSTKEIVLAVAIAMTLAIFLFNVLPFFLTSLLNFGGLIFNIVEGAIRLSILLLYLALIAFFGEFRRILQYHGAEHTAINAYEAGAELNVSDAREFSRFHPRCGTSFIFIVALISILLFSIMPNLGFYTRLAYRILLIPVIGAISYEALKLSDKYKKSKIMKVLISPGLGLQYLTTKKPDEKMIEVALEAVKKVNELAETTLH
jgi:uncharacterized protein YqhQ